MKILNNLEVDSTIDSSTFTTGDYNGSQLGKLVNINFDSNNSNTEFVFESGSVFIKATISI